MVSSVLINRTAGDRVRRSGERILILGFLQSQGVILSKFVVVRSFVRVPFQRHFESRHVRMYSGSVVRHDPFLLLHFFVFDRLNKPIEYISYI